MKKILVTLLALALVLFQALIIHQVKQLSIRRHVK